MEQPTTVKLCECGCGLPAPIARKNIERLGHVKGQPIRFIHGHNGSKLRGAEPRLFVYVGQRYGQGVVIDPKVRFTSPSGHVLRGARFRCDCGTEYVAEIADVVNGRKLSCGCRRSRNRVNWTGRRVGRLVAVRRVEGKPRCTWWLCLCDCGNEKVVSSQALSQGKTKSCGCLVRGPGKGLLTGQAALNKALNSYRRGARERGLSWGLTKEDFYRLTSLDCFYCGTPPSMTIKGRLYSGGCVYSGLDRVDNDLGYVLENVVPCCKICNHAKSDMPYADFTAWLARLTEHRLASF